MGLVDVLLARERHTLRSTESVETCRQLIGPARRRLGPAQPGIGPFFVQWPDPDCAQLFSAGPRARGIPRVLRVRLAADGSGTVADATAQISGRSFMVVGTMLVLFAFIGLSSVGARLSVGRTLLAAMFPLGLMATGALVLVLAKFVATGRTSDGLFTDLAFVLHAAAVDNTATPEHSSARPDPLWTSAVPTYGTHARPADVPSPPLVTTSPLPPGVAPPVLPSVVTSMVTSVVPGPRARRGFIDWLLGRRTVLLSTGLTPEECRGRLGSGSDTHLPVVAEWSSYDEFTMTRAWPGRGNAVAGGLVASGRGRVDQNVRLTTIPTRNAAPSARRKGLTPRTISSPAQIASAPVSTTVTTAPSVPDGLNNRLTKNATKNVPNARLGAWNTVISPVSRLRKSQFTDALSRDHQERDASV